MAIFDGQIEHQGDIIDQSGEELNRATVSKIEGGVGTVIPVPDNADDMDNPDFPSEQTVLMLELTTHDGEMKRYIFREDAVAALNGIVGDYAKIMMEVMERDSDVPDDVKRIISLMRKLQERFDDGA